ncbi:hypothetical protein LTR84_009374 [Exophiala bonariae]|uniref:Vacuolar protein sorting-associated protein 51 homolog n=1 Tax=Exophiala bonariae TaxID=1690606 RepID=A0AAV9MUE5_9EURO|nr:hypothetical protein LTR84_009374 [Exophiala bonariae]
MATITSPRSESPAANPIPRITSPQIPHSPSIGGTPTSSVRPSIEIPVRGTTSSPSLQQNGSGQQPHTQQRRNRAALRDYYNLKAKGAPAGGGGGGNGAGSMHSVSRTASIASNASEYSASGNATAEDRAASSSVSAQLAARLDDPAFDAEAHVAELLRSAGLRDILRTESVLVSEIRTLDGERKALVYDNYSKLIKAVGTIAEMQKGMHRGAERGYAAAPGGFLGQQHDRLGAAAVGKGGNRQPQSLGLEGVERLGEKLEALVAVVKELAPAVVAAEAGARVGAEDQAGRSVQKTRDLKRQKETVKWALDAPARLQDLVAKGEHDEAIKEHEAVFEVITRWKGVRGVDELRDKCANIMTGVKRTSSHSDDDQENDSDEDDDDDDSS